MAQRTLQRNEHIYEMERLYSQRAYSDAELAGRLNIDRTTVYKMRRFMEEKLELPFMEAERGRYRLDPHRRLSNIRVSPAEALALYLGARRLQQQTRTSQAAVASALEKLAQVFRNPLAAGLIQAARAVLEQQEDPQQAQVMSTLVRGWIEGIRVGIHHRKLHGQLRTYTVAPYQIEPAVWGDGVYLIGHSDYHDGLATFKVARIEHAWLTTEKFNVPAAFDSHQLLQHAWGIWHADEKPVRVRLRFSRQVTPRVMESIWHPSQTTQDLPDGGCLWEATIAEWREMEAWVRGWGADVEVLEPLELRRNVQRHLLKLCKLYQIPASTGTPDEMDEDYDDKWAAMLFREDV